MSNMKRLDQAIKELHAAHTVLAVLEHDRPNPELIADALHDLVRAVEEVIDTWGGARADSDTGMQLS